MFGDKNASCLQVWRGYLPLESFMIRFREKRQRGGQRNLLSCIFCFLKNFNLKYSICQGVIFSG